MDTYDKGERSSQTVVDAGQNILMREGEELHSKQVPFLIKIFTTCLYNMKLRKSK